MFHVHPECQLSLSYAEKWLLKMLAPGLLILLLLVQYLLRYSLYLLASGQVRLWFGQHGCARLCFKRTGTYEPKDCDGTHDTTTEKNPVAQLVTDSTTFDVEQRSTGGILSLTDRVQGGGGMQHFEDQWSQLGLGPAKRPIVSEPEPESGSEPEPVSVAHMWEPESAPQYSSDIQMESPPPGLTPESGMEALNQGSSTHYAAQSQGMDEPDQEAVAEKRSPESAGVDPSVELNAVMNHGQDANHSEVNNLSGSKNIRKVLSHTHAITFKDDADDHITRDHNETTAAVCSFGFTVTSAIVLMLVWTFFGEDMGPIEPPHVYTENQQVRTTAVFPLDQGLGLACLVLVGMWSVRALHVQCRGESAAHKERMERGKAARIELQNRLPRSLKDFGVSFSYQLRKGKIGIYIQTVNADAGDADEMAAMQPGQRVTHVLDGDGANLLDGNASVLKDRAQLYETSDAGLLSRIPQVNDRDYPGVQVPGKWVPNQIDERLAKAKKILDDEAHGVVRIKRPFTLLMEQRQRKDASMSWIFSLLNPARFTVQIGVIVVLAFVIAVSIGMASNASNLYGMIGLSACWLMFVCDLYLFTKEWWRRHQAPEESQAAAADNSDRNHTGTRCCQRIKGQLSRVVSWLLFIVGACFAWQTPFKTAALNNELHVQLWGEAEGSTWMGLEGSDALLRRLGMYMIALFALRNISGDKLRETWDNMASFNAEQKMDEVKFIAMEFLLIGYVMLVSAATQPMACHRDLDSKVKLSADNSIECDFCQVNAGIAVLGTAHTYGWLWKCSLVCSILYSAGLPIFFFCVIWNYAGTETLHTKKYLEHYGKNRTCFSSFGIIDF